MLLDDDGYSADQQEKKSDDEINENEDVDESKDDSIDEVYWDDTVCRKRRLFDTPWKKKSFRCSDSPGSPSCDEDCDGCLHITCSCTTET